MARKMLKTRKFGSPRLRRRYLAATPGEREQLRPILEAERETVLRRMNARGYRLEAVVADVVGVFTRGAGSGAIRLVGPPAAERTARVG
jgi:hypothetical protein